MAEEIKSYIRTKQEESQFTQLLNAIRSGGGGGSVVSWEQLITSGEHIANIDIDGVSTEVYAPKQKNIVYDLIGASYVNQDYTYQWAQWETVNTITLEIEESGYYDVEYTVMCDGYTSLYMGRLIENGSEIFEVIDGVNYAITRGESAIKSGAWNYFRNISKVYFDQGTHTINLQIQALESKSLIHHRNYIRVFGYKVGE